MRNLFAMELILECELFFHMHEMYILIRGGLIALKWFFFFFKLKELMFV